MIIVGIDPGLKGAIAFIGKKKVKVIPLPTLKLTKTKNCLDENRIRDYLHKYKTKISCVFIEKSQAMPKQGSVSMFNYGTGWGQLRGICCGLYLPYTLVHPKTWKKVMCKDMPASKEVSIITAKRLWPRVNLLPTKKSRKDSDGMADALCIAEYGKRSLLGDWNV